MGDYRDAAGLHVAVSDTRWESACDASNHDGHDHQMIFFEEIIFVLATNYLLGRQKVINSSLKCSKKHMARFFHNS